MLNISKLKQILIFISLQFVLCGSLVFADDLSDAKNAYGAGQFEEAATLLRPLVRQENIEAVYLLARMYEQGDGVEKDLGEAKRLFRIAAEKGNDAAQQRLDIFDAQGADDSVVIEWYLPSAEEGDTEAQYNLGFMYETGWGVLVNESDAVRWYREAAEMQHDVAQLRLGMMLIVGVGTSQSINDGLTLLRRSGENGNRIAEALIQDLFDAGDVSTEDAIRIVAGVRRVLDEGEKPTLETLRRSLELLHKKVEPVRSASPVKVKPKESRVDVVKAMTGSTSPTTTASSQKIDTKKDTKSATGNDVARNNKVQKKEKLQLHDEKPSPGGNLFNWYLNNANKGEADSQYHAGVMYIKGEQIERDADEGLRWIKLAAEQGHEMAAIYMELWRDDFSVNSFDSSVAVRWLKDAGRNFDTNAIFNLAFMYETGRGVQKNFNIAKQWYKFSAVEGHAESKRRLALLKKNSTGTDGVTAARGVDVEPDFPVIFALLFVLLACVGGYFYYRRYTQNVSIPAIDRAGSDEHAVISQAKNSHGLQVDDRKFFDELWESSPVSGASQVNAPHREKPVTNEQSEKKEAREKGSGLDQSKSSELSEVETKLAKAIDELMLAGKDGNSNAVISKTKNESNALNASSSFRQDKQGAQKEKVSDKSLKDQKPIHEKTLQTGSSSFSSSASKSVLEKQAERKTEKTGSSGGKFVSGEVAADSFLSNGISMDELAASRVSADNLFADGVAIDEAGKAVGRGGYNPQKLDADDMLRIDDLSTGGSISANSISNSSPKTRPIGPAASLLPKSRNDQPSFDVSVSSNDDIAHPDMQPTDLSAPMTNNEERSLAEVHFNIGLMFSSGDGVPQNEAQAAKWFLKAAEEGLPEAQFNIGQCYLTGSGVQKDSTLAMEWIQKAANNNYKPAQEELRKKNRAS